MSTPHEKREQFCSKIRKNNLQTIKANMRNLLLFHQSQSLICSLCRNDEWMFNQNLQHLHSLIIAIFCQDMICGRHIEPFIVKTLQIMNKYPRIYRKLIKMDGKQLPHLILRKIWLIAQIINNQLLFTQQGLYSQIKQSLSSKDQFNCILMDSTYGYGTWPIQSFQFEGQQQQWQRSTSILSIKVVTDIIDRDLQLLIGWFDQYPLHQLFVRVSGHNRIDMYRCVNEWTEWWCKDLIKYQKQAQLIIMGMTHHLQEVADWSLSEEYVLALMDWIAIVSINCNLSETILAVILNCLQKWWQIQKQKSYQILLLITSGGQELYQQKILNMLYQITQQFSSNSQMEIQQL